LTAFARRCRACRRLSRVLLRDCYDVVLSTLRSLRSAVACRLDVSDRQDQPRRPAVCPLSRVGGANGALSSARLARSEELLISSRHFVWPTFIGNFLFS